MMNLKQLIKCQQNISKREESRGGTNTKTVLRKKKTLSKKYQNTELSTQELLNISI